MTASAKGEERRLKSGIPAFSLLLSPFYFSLLLVAGILVGRGSAGSDDSLRLAQGEIIVTRLSDDNPRVIGGQVQGLIDAPIEQVWQLLNDFEKYPDFMPTNVRTWVIGSDALAEIEPAKNWTQAGFEAVIEPYRQEPGEADPVYVYEVLDMPFPLSNRWYLLKTLRDNEQYSMTWSRIAGNLRSSDGSWQLEQRDDKTVATYVTRSDAGISVPGFLVTQGLNQTLPDVIKSLRRQILKVQNQN
jgi:carbon monoxide dehydrogenase subunit G